MVLDDVDCGYRVVLSGSESDDESVATSTSESEVDLKTLTRQQFMDANKPAPRDGGGWGHGPRRPIWNNNLFWISWQTIGTFLRINVRRQAMTGPDALSPKAPYSKSFQPERDFEDLIEDPVRSMFVLRAWAIWRCKAGGWHTEDDLWTLHVQKDEFELDQQIRLLGNSDGLLDNQSANNYLKMLLPEMVTRLCRIPV